MVLTEPLLQPLGGLTLALSPGSLRRVLTELLIQLSAVATEERVFVIGATNRPMDLDPALMRRFDRRLQVHRSFTWPAIYYKHAAIPGGYRREPQALKLHVFPAGATLGRPHTFKPPSVDT